MNFILACECLELDIHDQDWALQIKKKYHLLALKYHPDKNTSPQAIERFQEIQAAYEYLDSIAFQETHDVEESNEDDAPYVPSYSTFLDLFLGNVENAAQVAFVHKVLDKLLHICEKQAIQIIEHINNKKFTIIYRILSKYKNVFHFSQHFYDCMEKRHIYWLQQGKMKEKRMKETYPNQVSEKDKETFLSYKKVIDAEWNITYDVLVEKEKEEEEDSDCSLKPNETMILRPSLDDLLSHNVFKCSYHERTYAFPLWHHELLYEHEEEILTVQIIPDLPSELFWIDEDNNLHQKIEYNLFELWAYVEGDKSMQICFGTRRFIFYPSQLQMQPIQTWVWENSGLSKIQENIYDISRKANVILHIYISTENKNQLDEELSC